MRKFLSYKGVLWFLLGCFLIVSALPVSGAGIGTSFYSSISDIVLGLIGEDVEVGTLKTASIEPIDSSSANVVKLPSGSSATLIQKWNDSGDVTRMDLSGSGGLRVSSNSSGTHDAFRVETATRNFAIENQYGSMKFTVRATGNGALLALESGGARMGVYGYPTTSSYFDFGCGQLYANDILLRAGHFSVTDAGLITSDSSALVKLGYYGETTSDAAEFPQGTAYTPMSAAPSNPTTGSILYNLAADGTTNIATEHGKALSVSETYTSASDIDVLLEFSGGTNAGWIKFIDDASGGFELNRRLYICSTFEATGTVKGNSLLSTNGYYGDTTAAPAEFPKGWLDSTANDSEITADTTLTSGLHFVRIDTSGGTNITIDLPASPVTGQSYHFKVTGYSGSITIDGNGKNIDGVATSSNLTFTNDRLGVIYDGTEWWITDNA